MKSLTKEKVILENKLWPDLLKLVEEHTKSRYDIKPNIDTFSMTSMLRDRFCEYADQSALNSTIVKSQKGKLTEKEALFLRKKIVALLKQNSELKYRDSNLLINPM